MSARRPDARRRPAPPRERVPEPPLPRTALAVPLAAALLALAVYAFTLAPGLPAGDSGELITVAATSGVAHPPGYPLYTMLGRVWIELFRFGSIAWRMNLCSAVCAACAVGGLGAVVLRLTRSATAGWVSAVLLAFSPPFWKNALVAEVFALNALLAVIALAAFVRLLEAPADARGRPLWVLAALHGLAIAHHHTLVLLLLPIDAVVVGLALRRPTVRPFVPSPALARACLLAFVLALAPLADIPLAAARSPLLSWGDVHSIRELLRLLLRVDYGTFRLDPLSAGHVASGQHVGLYLGSLLRDFGAFGLLLVAAGALALSRRHALAVMCAGFAALQLLFFTRIGYPIDPPLYRGVVERFYILPDVVFAMIAGLGAAFVLAQAPARGRAIAGIALALVFTAIPLVSHGARVSQRGNRFMDHLASDVLASVPRGAVLFTQGDVFHNSLAYRQQVEHERPDVTVIDQELMSYDWYMRALRRREPDLLPAFDRAELLTLVDGRVIEGMTLPEDSTPAPSDTLTFLVAEGAARIARAEVRSIVPVSSSDLFLPTKRGFRRSNLAPLADDRYSGLPPTRNVFWIQHLLGRRPVAFLGLKEDSWSLRYDLVPEGLVLVAAPLGAAPSVEVRAARALVLLATLHLEEARSHHDAWSFEVVERSRLLDFVEASAILLSQPSTQSVGEGSPGLAALEKLIGRAEPDSIAEPSLYRVAGLLRQRHSRSSGRTP